MSDTGREPGEQDCNQPDDSVELPVRMGCVDSPPLGKPKRTRDQPDKCCECGLKRRSEDQMKEAAGKGVKRAHQGATAILVTREGTEKCNGGR